MFDPRIAEIEFLSSLEQERPSSVAYWDRELSAVHVRLLAARQLRWPRG